MPSPPPPTSNAPRTPELPEVPLFNKKALSTVAAITAAVWLTALVSGSKIVIIAVAVLTVALLGLLGWAWRQVQKQKKVLALLQSAQGSPEARQAALAELAAADPANKDVLSRIAKAQLQAQEDPDGALATLSGIDLAKVPSDAADQVRAFRCQLLLLKNRAKDARDLADQITVPSTGPLAQRAMLAAVVAEAWARTGKATEALVVLEGIDPGHADLAQVRPLVLYARVFAWFATGKKERCVKDMKALMAQDMNLLGRFVAPGPGIHLDLRRLATEVLQDHPDVRKMARHQAVQMARRMR